MSNTHVYIYIYIYTVLTNDSLVALQPRLPHRFAIDGTTDRPYYYTTANGVVYQTTDPDRTRQPPRWSSQQFPRSQRSGCCTTDPSSTNAKREEVKIQHIAMSERFEDPHFRRRPRAVGYILRKRANNAVGGGCWRVGMRGSVSRK